MRCKHTTPSQRRDFYKAHQRGDTYPEIAQRYDVSKECVRYWCRRQRDGGCCESVYHKKPTGVLSSFDPLVRYCILRLRLEHPRRGPDRILFWLGKQKSLEGKKLPSKASIGRYLHQWPRFRRKPKQKVEDQRPNPPTRVHQRWQLDFKVGIAQEDGTVVDLHTIRDPVGEACIGAVVCPTEQVSTRTKRVSMEDIRSTLRRSFAHWGTLPQEVQTDGEPTLISRKKDAFPSTFTLWLKGLDIEHLVIGHVKENAEVERCHRTVNDYAIVGNEKCSLSELQSMLDDAVRELAFELTSRAEGCAGRTPVQAHPELLRPERPFRPDHELALFDLRRVDAFLSTFTWTRKVGKTGQICIGGQHKYYSVGRVYARQVVEVRFDPADRHFVFHLPPSEEDDSRQEGPIEIGRRPARDLEVEDLMGIVPWPEGLIPQQLVLPLCLAEG